MRSPSVRRVSVRGRWCNYFLAGVVQRSQSAALDRSRSAVPSIPLRRRSRRLARVMIRWLSLMVAARTYFLVRTSFLVAQKGGHVANVARPTAVADKVLSTGRRVISTSMSSRWPTVGPTPIVHFRIVRGRAVHVMVLRVIVERLRIIACRRTRSVDAIRRKDLSSSAGLFWWRVRHLTVALIVRDFGFTGYIRLVVQFVALGDEYVLGV
jgi:hypothetical protein